LLINVIISGFIRIIVTGEPYSKYKTNEAINGCLREAKRALSNSDKLVSKRQKLFDKGNNAPYRSPSISNIEL
jgi:hypothetical protein